MPEDNFNKHCEGLPVNYNRNLNLLDEPLTAFFRSNRLPGASSSYVRSAVLHGPPYPRRSHMSCDACQK